MGNRVMLISVHGDPLTELGRSQAGGQNVYVREVALGLQKLGWDVTVFSRWEAGNRSVERLGPRGRVVRLAVGKPGFIPKEKLLPLLPAFVAQMETYLARTGQRFDVIHSNYWLSGLVGLRLREHLKIPQIHTFHSLGSVKARTVSKALTMHRRLEAEKEIVHRADFLTAGTVEEKKLLLDDYGASPGAIRFVPCGVDPAIFRPGSRSEAKRILGLAERHTGLYVGRLQETKGLSTLLEALKLVKAKAPHWAQASRFLLVGGEAADLAKLKAAVYEQGLADWVQCVGAQPQERLPLYYRAADVCVVPSYYETFGLVAVEAMACATPVIASKVGGLKCTVKDGYTGYHVPPQDASALALRLVELWTDEARARRLGQQGAGWVASQFTWPEASRRLSTLYREAKTCRTQLTRV